MGRNSGLEQSFTQYCARRGSLNAVNCESVTFPVSYLCLLKPVHAPKAVTDQIYDHQNSNAMKIYLDEEIRFDTQTTFLDRPSDEIVRQLARSMTLTVDPNAPTTLSPELSKQLVNNKRVLQLQRRNNDLTQILKKKYKLVRLASRNDPLYQRKKQINASLQRAKSRLRNRMLEKARKDHFRYADLAVFEAQFDADGVSSVPESDQNVKQTELPHYDVLERAEIVRLTCIPSDELPFQKKHAQRLETLMTRMSLCNRQETRVSTRSRPMSKNPTTPPKKTAETSKNELSQLNPAEEFPLTCKPTQCIFCLNNESKSHAERNFEYARPNKMMNHVEKHLQNYEPSESIPCSHPKCRAEAVILSDVKVFKNHTTIIHEIFLRV